MKSASSTYSRRVASVALALSLAFSAGCRLHPTEPPGPGDAAFVQLLYGTWNWVYAIGGIQGSTLTPQSEGYTLRVVLLPPNRVDLFRDDGLEVSTTFEFLPARDPLGIEQPARLRYAEPLLGSDEQQVAFSIEGELILIDPCCDLFQWVWTSADP